MRHLGAWMRLRAVGFPESHVPDVSILPMGRTLYILQRHKDVWPMSKESEEIGRGVW